MPAYSAGVLVLERYNGGQQSVPKKLLKGGFQGSTCEKEPGRGGKGKGRGKGRAGREVGGGGGGAQRQVVGRIAPPQLWLRAEWCSGSGEPQLASEGAGEWGR